MFKQILVFKLFLAAASLNSIQTMSYCYTADSDKYYIGISDEKCRRWGGEWVQYADRGPGKCETIPAGEAVRYGAKMWSLKQAKEDCSTEIKGRFIRSN